MFLAGGCHGRAASIAAPPQPAAAHDDGTGSLTRAAARLAAQHRPHGPAAVPLPQSLRSNAPGIFGEDRFEAWAAQFAEIARQSQNRLSPKRRLLHETSRTTFPKPLGTGAATLLSLRRGCRVSSTTKAPIRAPPPACRGRGHTSPVSSGPC